MMWTQRHHIGAMKIIGCCLFMLDFSDCGCQVSTIIVIRRYLDIRVKRTIFFFFWTKGVYHHYCENVQSPNIPNNFFGHRAHFL